MDWVMVFLSVAKTSIDWKGFDVLRFHEDSNILEKGDTNNGGLVSGLADTIYTQALMKSSHGKSHRFKWYSPNQISVNARRSRKGSICFCPIDYHALKFRYTLFVVVVVVIMRTMQAQPNQFHSIYICTHSIAFIIVARTRNVSAFVVVSQRKGAKAKARTRETEFVCVCVITWYYFHFYFLFLHSHFNLSVDSCLHAHSLRLSSDVHRWRLIVQCFTLQSLYHRLFRNIVTFAYWMCSWVSQATCVCACVCESWTTRRVAHRNPNEM